MAAARIRLLANSGDCTARLAFYAPWVAQPAHEDAAPQLSVLLAGSLLETVGRTEVHAEVGTICAKAEGLRHADVYGPNGALIFSISARPGTAAADMLKGRPWSWRPINRRVAVGAVVAQARPEDAFHELIAAGSVDRDGRGEPPAWLARTRERLTEDPAGARLSSLAREAGVHPISLSRAFIRHYDITPTAYRRRQMVAAAVRRTLLGEEPLARTAYASGFADQSHMTRSMKALTGFPAASLRRLLA